MLYNLSYASLHYFFLLQGIPNNGEFDNIDDLVKTITCIIFNCSAAHAVHFNQYDDYAFPPNYPALLHGKLPKNKVLLIIIIII